MLAKASAREILKLFAADADVLRAHHRERWHVQRMHTHRAYPTTCVRRVGYARRVSAVGVANGLPVVLYVTYRSSFLELHLIIHELPWYMQA